MHWVSPIADLYNSELFMNLFKKSIYVSHKSGYCRRATKRAGELITDGISLKWQFAPDKVQNSLLLHWNRTLWIKMKDHSNPVWIHGIVPQGVLNCYSTNMSEGGNPWLKAKRTGGWTNQRKNQYLNVKVQKNYCERKLIRSPDAVAPTQGT